MHLVDFETFNRLPAGTIFAPYIPSVLKEGLAIKVDHGREFNFIVKELRDEVQNIRKETAKPKTKKRGRPRKIE